MKGAELVHEIADLRLEVRRVARGRYQVSLSRAVSEASSSRYRNDFRWNDIPDLARMLLELYEDSPPHAKRRPRQWLGVPSRFDHDLSFEEMLAELRRDPKLPPKPWPPRNRARRR